MIIQTYHSKKRAIAFLIVLSLILSQWIFVPSVSAFDVNQLSSNEGWKSAVPMNGQFDYINDQQTGSGDVSQDIVGDASRPAFYTKYDASTDEIAFRFRINNQDTQSSAGPDNYAFKNFAFVGVDAATSGAFDGKLDFFLGIYSVDNNDIPTNNNGTLGIYNADPTKENSSPNTTGIINPPIVSIEPDKNSNFIITTADGTSFGTQQDYFLSFKISLSAINSAMQTANKSISITSSTALKFIIGTAAQDNSFNQDVGGLNGINTKSTTSWSDLGAFSSTTTFNGDGPVVTFYSNKDSANPQSEIYTTVTAVSGFALGVLPTITSEGAYFLGWSTTSGSGAAVDFLTSTQITTNTSVYAVWGLGDLPKYTLSFYTNTHEDTSLYTTLEAISGSALGAAVPTVTHASYTFQGWSTTTSSLQNTLTPTKVIDANTTYYAIWAEIAVVTFDENYPYGSTTVVNAISGSALGSDMPYDPSRSGYTFAGWFPDSNSDGSGASFTSTTTVSAATTYYAIWASNVKFWDGVNTTTEAIISGSSIGAVIMPGPPNSPTPAAYTFSHWGICPDGTTVITEGSIITEPVTVCAIYKPIVNFNYNGSGTPSVTRSALSGAALGTDFPSTPTRTGYIFSGWSSSPTTLVSPFTSLTAVTVPVTYYAIWTADPVVQTNNTGGGGGGALPPVVQFTITYDSNGGTTAANPAKQTVDSGGTVGTLPTPPTKADYAFAGWNTLIDGSGLKFLATTIVKASMTVFAQWLPQVTKVIEGVVTEKETGGPLPGVVVILRGPDGKEVGRTTTDDQGRYQIPNVPPGNYTITMQKLPYSVLELPITVPSDGGSNVPVNGALDKYRITLTAYPDTIIGDGINETILAAKVVDQNGQPLGGVLVTFTAPLGTFPNGPLTWTDNTGLATIPYRSSDLSSSTTPQRIPVTAQVNDPARGLNAQARIYVIFTPYDKDLAIVLKADQMRVQEGASAGFVIQYTNKSVSTVEDVFLKVTVPDTMEFEAASMNGAYANGEITWNAGTLGRNVQKQLTFVLRAKQLTQNQQYTTLNARIGSNQKIILNNLQDDQSSLRVLLFSNRYEQAHTLYIKGYPDGLVKPERTVTRAEVAAMFTRLLGWSNDPAKKNSYTDVVDWEWYNDYVEAVIEHDLFKGYENNTFQPNKPITRAELATAIARQLAISKEQRSGYLFKLSPFADTVNHWAEGTLEELYRYQVVSGDGSGFRPDDPISRQETVKMMNRLFYRGTLQGTMPAYPDNLPSNWSYYEMEEAVRTHSFQYQPDGTETVRQ